ncbi:hypothetical protein llap_5286 [Limosa lapponica baueri]|uniref:Uncharacterized protein n=1 Tax=Limosa lapponica baueri TaxID=1758121 RepID=A0A2I0UED3_LIMLA|nr:hypothetical protein llap_5286 [Limosa lapponica baueri]
MTVYTDFSSLGAESGVAAKFQLNETSLDPGGMRKTKRTPIAIFSFCNALQTLHIKPLFILRIMVQLLKHRKVSFSNVSNPVKDSLKETASNPGFVQIRKFEQGKEPIVPETLPISGRELECHREIPTVHYQGSLIQRVLYALYGTEQIVYYSEYNEDREQTVLTGDLGVRTEQG